MFKFFFTIAILFSLEAACQGLRVQGKQIVNERGENVLLRGIGLGGWMLQEPYMLRSSGIAANQQEIRARMAGLAGKKNTKHFYKQWLANHCTRQDIDSLAAWGFNSVRLPMHYNLFTVPITDEPAERKQSWLEAGFSLTDSLLKWCAANKIYLILDLHAAPGGQGNDIPISDRDTLSPSLWQSEANHEKTIALWKKLAQRYANEPWIGGYDLINEPNWGFSDEKDKHGCAEKENVPLRQLYVDITNAIREVDTSHIIFIEGNCWGNNYKGIFPLWDKQTVLSFHKYWNNNDRAAIQPYIDLRDKYNVPIWAGETGENSNSWYANAIALFEANNIGWNMWPLKKMGINNPMEIPVRSGYQSMLNYWQGTGEKPTQQQVIAALQQLALDIHASQNVVHRDVIYAMTGHANQTGAKPFAPHQLSDSLVVFAVDYDMGTNGLAYFDNDEGNYWVSSGTRTKWNKGGKYRNDGVDIDTCSDAVSNGFAVASIEDGEWMQYTLHNQKAGSFNLIFRVENTDPNAEIKVMVNEDDAGRLKLSTHPQNIWYSSVLQNISLPAGFVRLRLHAVHGGYKMNQFQLKRISTQP